MNPKNTQIINLLNDGETYTDANHCSILAFTEEDTGEWATIEEVEQALEEENFSYVATFETLDGALTIHIHDASGVPVTINDERGRLG